MREELEYNFYIACSECGSKETIPFANKCSECGSNKLRVIKKIFTKQKTMREELEDLIKYLQDELDLLDYPDREERKGFNDGWESCTDIVIKKINKILNKES